MGTPNAMADVETGLGPDFRKLAAEELRRLEFPPLPERPRLWEDLCAAVENGPRGLEEKLFKEFLRLQEQRFEGQATMARKLWLI